MMKRINYAADPHSVFSARIGTPPEHIFLLFRPQNKIQNIVSLVNLCNQSFLQLVFI